MKISRKTKKIKRQRGRGILSNGIKSKVKIGDTELNYKKTCPDDFVMCDHDEVNFGLCVPNNQQDLCSDPNYEFKYVPPDENDRNGINPKNRLSKEENGKGSIQDRNKMVKVFNIEYDGDYNIEDPNNYNNMLYDDVIINEETGRLKSYTPEFHPTSCAIQQKSSATIEVIYKPGDNYKKRISDSPVSLELTQIPNKFKILTQNALGLYRGIFGQTPESGSGNEATYDLMRLRTALLRQFLKDRKPDFMCLQESTRTFVDLLDKDEVKDMYKYMYPTEEEMIALENNGSNATTSLFSKYPVNKSTTYMLQGNSSYYNALGIYEFDNLVIFNVYMQAGSEISPGQKYKWENYARCRRQQLMFVKQKIDEIKNISPKAIVVLGDFNFELNSIRYKGEGSGRANRDENNHLMYDPDNSDMKWSEHKFLVGPNGLNLNDSYKELYIDNPSVDVREGYTEYTDVNTFRFLGKLEEKKLRYDGIFINNDLTPITCEVVNNTPTILDNDETTIRMFENNGINDYRDNIEKYNIEYDKYMIFNPKGNIDALRKKDEFLFRYKTHKNKSLTIENGFELFVSDHFGVMAELEFKQQLGGRRVKRRYTKKRKNRRRRKTMRI